MKKYYINYANDNYKLQQKIALISAKYLGNFDKVIGFSSKDLNSEFHKKYYTILSQKKGAGFWLWKPYIINETLSRIQIGDYLFYSDSGVLFLKKVDLLIKELEMYNQDIMGYELPLKESQWTKKELFINMNCNSSIMSNSNQILASFILIKKSNFSVNFFNSFLEYSCNEMNLTDKHNILIKQDNDFIEHRHDQSIFSLLYKLHNLKSFKDPSQYGINPELYSGCDEKIYITNDWTILSNKRKIRIKNYLEKYSLILFHNRKYSLLTNMTKYIFKQLFIRFKL